jgi:hypothetical protein
VPASRSHPHLSTRARRTPTTTGRDDAADDRSEASRAHRGRQATAEVFESWIDAATDYFAAAGIRRVKARELALSILCLLEGGFVFSRAMRTTAPLEIAGETAAAAVRAALPAKTSRRRAAR